MIDVLDIVISNQESVSKELDIIYSSNMKQYRARFTFSDNSWDGYNKIVIFDRVKNYDTPIGLIIKDEASELVEIINDREFYCIIPWEILVQPGYFTISLYGTITDGEPKKKTIVINNKFTIQNSGNTTVYPRIPTPNIYEQLLGIIDTEDIKEDLESLEKELQIVEENIDKKIEEFDKKIKEQPTSYVFNNLEELNNELLKQDFVNKLVVGDNFFIRDKEVSDYWWDGKQKLPLESEKIELPEVTKNLKDGEGNGALEQLHDTETWKGIDTNGNEIDYETKALGKFSAIYGGKSYAEGGRSLAGGTKSVAKGSGSLAFGDTNYAGDYATAFGYQTRALGAYSHTEGRQTVTEESNAHAEGSHTKAKGNSSHAEGHETIASGESSHAEGSLTESQGGNSHAEGSVTHAKGDNSHAEGESTTAGGNASHAEGTGTKASQNQAHAEGWNTEASGYHSHSEGSETLASGNFSHAGGKGTIAAGEAQTAIGRYNVENSDALFIVGNGNNANRSTAFKVNHDGSAEIQTSGTNDSNVVNYKQLVNYVRDNAKSQWDNACKLLFTKAEYNGDTGEMSLGGDVCIYNHQAEREDSKGFISIGNAYQQSSGDTRIVLNHKNIYCDCMGNGNQTLLSDYGLNLYCGNPFLENNLEDINRNTPNIQIQCHRYDENYDWITHATNIGVMGITHEGKFVTWKRIFEAVEKIESAVDVSIEGQ